MKEHDMYVAVVEKYTFDGANTFALMKHPHPGGDFMRCCVDFVICEIWGDFSFQGCDLRMLKPTKILN